jgi:hypothetical protein
MEDIPITGLEELQKHLEQLLEDPGTPVDAKLFDEIELQLTGKVSCAVPSFCCSFFANTCKSKLYASPLVVNFSCSCVDGKVRVFK